ncbi:metal-sensing transcriptional repressor [Candidatus Gracilibacteria bacterium]|nr:metal-sensing transcriptional repressor [Candidatus Gracilibacteria bacterium]
MDHKKVLIGLKKAKTSLEKINQMIEDDKYCIDIIQQNLAVIGLLKSVNINLLESHLGCCVKSRAKAGNEKELDKKMQEILNIVKLAQDK